MSGADLASPAVSVAWARARLFYLVAAAVLAFALPAGWPLGALGLVQLGLALAARVPGRELARRAVKLLGLSAFIVASYSLVSEDPAVDRWVTVPGVGLSLNAGGAELGLFMVLRLAAVVLASVVARGKDPRVLVVGLRSVGVPVTVASSLEAVLALVGEGAGGGQGGGRGGGRGQGKGRGRDSEDGAAEAEGSSKKTLGQRLRAALALDGVADRLEARIEKARAHLESASPSHAASKDAAVIAGSALAMLGVKALKVLPSIPFAPGHKLVLLTPLYIVASLKTKSRFGATLTGLTMGAVSFLLGDGRYGVFEIAKHVTPGVVCDLVVPLMKAGGRTPGALAWSVVGGVVAAGRFSTIVLVTLLAQTPAMAYAILLPGMLVHCTFGALSGYVTFRMVRRLTPAPAEAAAAEPVPVSPK